MKIRNGFVSNSSSSSFVVHVKDAWDNKREPFVNQNVIDLLIKEGFDWVSVHSPHDLESMARKAKRKKVAKKYQCYLGKSVICNQDVEIDFLTKNKIPFKGCCHYGHETVLFDGQTMHTILNPGLVAEMYGVKMLDLKGLKKSNLVSVEVVK